MQPLPVQFPALPPCDTAWSADIVSAHRIISDIYEHAIRVIYQHDTDPPRLAFHINALSSDGLSLLQALEADESCLPHEWLWDCSVLLGNSVDILRSCMEDARERDGSNIEYPDLVHVVRTGRRGRPRKIINIQYLCEIVSNHRQVNLKDLASTLGVHRNTLRQCMARNGLKRAYTVISDHQLDELVREFKRTRPLSGLRYLIGFLRMKGIRLQRWRALYALRRVDAVGWRLRERRTAMRRKYSVPRSNALWHVDGYHKLIRWGFVVHAFVDGFDRTITGIDVNTNNEASTVFDVFVKAVEEFGLPSRLRGDRGGENITVATYMVITNGLNRGSFIWGSSMHNTRVERMWVEVGTQFSQAWRGFFNCLERLHRLDVRQPAHLWLLHVLFLNAVKEDCQKFQQEWNARPMSSQGMHGRSPNDVRILSHVKFGIYKPDHHMNQGPSVPMSQLVAQIASHQSTNVRHEAINVPCHKCPLPGHSLHLFSCVLAEVVEKDVIPAGYGFHADEWDGDSYPVVEILQRGRRGKEIHITLPEIIWQPRAKLWVQALNVLAHFLQ